MTRVHRPPDRAGLAGQVVQGVSLDHLAEVFRPLQQGEGHRAHVGGEEVHDVHAVGGRVGFVRIEDRDPRHERRGALPTAALDEVAPRDVAPEDLAGAAQQARGRRLLSQLAIVGARDRAQELTQIHGFPPSRPFRISERLFVSVSEPSADGLSPGWRSPGSEVSFAGLVEQAGVVHEPPGVGEVLLAGGALDLAHIVFAGLTALGPAQIRVDPPTRRVDPQRDRATHRWHAGQPDMAGTASAGGGVLFLGAFPLRLTRGGLPGGGFRSLFFPVIPLGHQPSLRSGFVSSASATERAIAWASRTGTALPSCRICSLRGPIRKYSSGKVMTRETSRTVM